MDFGDKLWLIFLGAFAVVGIVCTCLAYSIWNKNRYIKTKGIETTGQVIGHHQQRQIKTTTALAVIVQYVDYQNQPRVYYSTTYTTPALFQVGENIRLWYLREKPDEILMEGKDEWLLPLVLGGFGLVFSLIGLPGLIKSLVGLLFG